MKDSRSLALFPYLYHDAPERGEGVKFSDLVLFYLSL